jgi:hypothetical protein
MSRASVKVEGELPLLGLDERPVVGFSSIVRDEGVVTIRTEETEVVFRTGKKTVTIPRKIGVTHKLTPVDEAQVLEITEEIAERVKYLAGIAFTDASRPELCCVMLAGGKGMACNQKAVAVFNCEQPGGIKGTAIPLALAKMLALGDRLYPGKGETTLKSGMGTYIMPAPVRAQKDFPIALLPGLAKTAVQGTVKVRADKLMAAVRECDACLGSISRTEIVLNVNTLESGEGIEITAQNGGARYQGIVGTKGVGKLMLKISLEELMPLVDFISKQDTVEISAGKKNNEAFLRFSSGWVMYPSK